MVLEGWQFCPASMDIRKRLCVVQEGNYQHFILLFNLEDLLTSSIDSLLTVGSTMV